VGKYQAGSLGPWYPANIGNFSYDYIVTATEELNAAIAGVLASRAAAIDAWWDAVAAWETIWPVAGLYSADAYEDAAVIVRGYQGSGLYYNTDGFSYNDIVTATERVNAGIAGVLASRAAAIAAWWDAVAEWETIWPNAALYTPESYEDAAMIVRGYQGYNGLYFGTDGFSYNDIVTATERVNAGIAGLILKSDDKKDDSKTTCDKLTNALKKIMINWTKDIKVLIDGKEHTFCGNGNGTKFCTIDGIKYQLVQAGNILKGYTYSFGACGK
jgi:hypothetical protein